MRFFPQRCSGLFRGNNDAKLFNKTGHNFGILFPRIRPEKRWGNPLGERLDWGNAGARLWRGWESESEDLSAPVMAITEADFSSVL